MALASHRLKMLWLLTLFSISCVPAAAAEPFRVGVSLPLSGPFAEYGIAVRNGIELFRKEDPRSSSNVKFIYEDDRYEPKLTISAMNKLKGVDHINVFFVWGNEPALAVAPLAERNGLPTLVVAQHPKAGAGYKYVVRFTNPALDYSGALARYLRNKGLKRLAVIQSEISFFNILLEELGHSLKSDENLEVLDSFTTTESDFRSTLAKLRSKHFDALGVYLVAPQLVQFFRQAAEQKLSFPIFGPTQFESKALVSQSLGYMNGAVFAHMNVKPDFVRRYIEAYSDDLQISYAANAYEFARITADLFGALEETPSAGQILSSYAGVPEGDGVAGHYRFRNTPAFGKYFEFEIVVKKIENGEIVVLAPEASKP